jgi:thiamine monophosphate synthase
MASLRRPSAKVSGRSTAVVLWLMIALVFLPIVAIHGIAAALAARDADAGQQTAALISTVVPAERIVLRP